jgi:minimal PKS acyl carrier protein
MAIQPFTLDDLKRLLLAAAGIDDSIDFDDDILDTTFDDLGYESLALLETGSLIEREFDLSLDDGTVVDAETPRALIEVVNTHLSQVV